MRGTCCGESSRTPAKHKAIAVNPCTAVDFTGSKAVMSYTSLRAAEVTGLEVARAPSADPRRRAADRYLSHRGWPRRWRTT